MSETEDKLARELGGIKWDEERKAFHIPEEVWIKYHTRITDAFMSINTFVSYLLWRKCLELTERNEELEHRMGLTAGCYVCGKQAPRHERIALLFCKDHHGEFNRLEDEVRELTEQRERGIKSAGEFFRFSVEIDRYRGWGELDRLQWLAKKQLFNFAEAYASSRLAAWRCFFCNEIFTDEAEAKEHFGSDEYELCAPPGCIDPLRTDEKARLKELHQAEAHAMKMQQDAEENDEAKGLLEIYRSEIGRYFGIVGGVTASTPHQARLVLEAEQGKVIAAESRLAEVTAQLQALGQQLEFDRTKVAECITDVKDAVRGRSWLMEGRGPYEWNDDRWYKEFSYAAEEILKAVEPLDKIAGDWSKCPKSYKEVVQARIDLQAETATLSKRLEVWKSRAKKFQDGYNDKSTEATALLIQKLQLEADGATPTLIRQRNHALERARKYTAENATLRAELAQAKGLLEESWTTLCDVCEFHGDPEYHLEVEATRELMKRIDAAKRTEI